MNKMILVSGLLAIAVAGCTNNDSNPMSQAADATGQAAVETSAEPCVGNAFYSPLPDASIRFGFPFRVARDRVYETADGKPRRGISLEYLDGSADEVWSGVVSSMRAAGFEQSDAATAPQYSGSFAKKGQLGIFVKLSPEPPKGATGEDVKGSVWISWTRQDAPSAA